MDSMGASKETFKKAMARTGAAAKPCWPKLRSAAAIRRDLVSPGAASPATEGADESDMADLLRRILNERLIKCNPAHPFWQALYLLTL